MALSLFANSPVLAMWIALLIGEVGILFLNNQISALYYGTEGRIHFELEDHVIAVWVFRDHILRQLDQHIFITRFTTTGEPGSLLSNWRDRSENMTVRAHFNRTVTFF